jgi:hypothetical protein
MDFWVATDGITTVRFLDAPSALTYCYETGFPADELLLIRFNVSLRENQFVVESWTPDMDPEDGDGVWDDPLTPTAHPAGIGDAMAWIPFPAMAYPEEVEVEDFGNLARQHNLPYRDAAARIFNSDQ